MDTSAKVILVTTVLSSTCFFNTASVSLLHIVFNMFAFLQLVVWSPLIRIKMPANATTLFNGINSAATFDVFYPHLWFPYIFDLPRDEAYSETFNLANISSTYVINNLGSLVVVIAFNMV